MPRTPILTAAVLAVFCAVATPAPATADEPGIEGKPLEDLGPAIEKEVGRLLGIMELFLRNIPTYEMPEILDNGDIIIRRKRPEDAPETPPASEPDMSRT